jgi:hypothetical protein
LIASTRSLFQTSAPPQEDRVEQPPLGPEIVVDQGGIHAGLARHFADGDAVKAVLGEQVFGRVEDQVPRIGGAGGPGLGRTASFRGRRIELGHDPEARPHRPACATAPQVGRPVMSCQLSRLTGG